MHKSVLIVQRRLTEYRVPLFERLHRQLAAAGIRLQVIYGTPTPAEKMRSDQGSLPWGIPIPCRYLSLGDSNAAFQRIPIELIEQQDLVILPHENSMFNNYVLLLLRHSHRARLAFWGHGANFQSNAGNRLRDRFKAWISQHGHWWFAYTAFSAQRVAENGFPAERITCLNNAVDTQALMRWRDSLPQAEVDALRSTLSVHGKKVGAFIGSLHRDKRIEFLLAAADRLRERIPEFELLVIGDGPLRQVVQDFAATRPWCRWVGARQGRDKALHMALGQVLLNPGMVGLGILDGFAMRLPLVTTDCGIHSPEIAYLEPGKNGLVTVDNIPAFVEGVAGLFDDTGLRDRLVGGCDAASSRYTLDQMAERFCDGIVHALDAPPIARPRGEAPASDIENIIPAEGRRAIPEWHIAVIWQRFLPYHVARIRRLRERCAELGYRLTAIEVASQDASYGFNPAVAKADFDHVCCFPDSSYHDDRAAEIHAKVLAALNRAQPDVVFAPATPFPEGMAAVAYRRQSGNRTFMMDDAWQHTDRRGAMVTAVKRLVHANIDGVFIPAQSHAAYYRKLGFPQDKIVFGVDVVDNDRFSQGADRARTEAVPIKVAAALLDDYFLYVGRFVPRKGLETLLGAYARYRARAGGKPWDLVLVGGGDYLKTIWRMAADIEGLRFAGPQFGDELCRFYGRAKALVVPSVSDPWALVVNEGLAAGLPVIVSTGCGAARTLVSEGENGWCFPPEDVGALTELMLRAGASTPEALAQMGRKSRQIIGAWSLDRFVDGVLQAMQLPRSMPAGLMSDLAIRLWKGRVSVN